LVPDKFGCLMVNPSSNPQSPRQLVQDERKTRPERRFEARRVLFILLPIIFILFVAFIGIRACQNPMGGGLAAKGRAVTPTAALVQLGGAIPTPVIVVATRARDLGLDCRIVSDVERGGFFLPSQSKVLVVGFSFAAGGLVEVSGFGWMPQGNVKCDGSASDMYALEKMYSVQYTPTARVTSVPERTQTPVRIYINAPTHTPYPTFTPLPTGAAFFNSVSRESDSCWRFSVAGVREIWVDGRTPVAGGSLVCGITRFEVVIQ